MLTSMPGGKYTIFSEYNNHLYGTYKKIDIDNSFKNGVIEY